ncbi:hypothetical protein AB4874_18765 [Thioclava sp. 15-R06ZXC-3]|uniref:Uncharacterized protein n=1 Tax=Thioclava arctica TaxID=3238301 RepID=A0ABV3TPU6_9RHOB
MANDTTITRFDANEDTSRYTPSPISTQFSKFLGQFADWIEKERDIADVNVWDPAFSGWLRDAELAQERVTGALSALIKEAPTRPSDKPLKLAAYLVHLTMCSECPGEVARFADVARRKADHFLMAEDSATHRRVNAMIRTALTLFESFVALDLVGYAPGDDLDTWAPCP